MKTMAWEFFRRDCLIEQSSRFSLFLHLVNVVLSVAGYTFLSRLVESDALARWAPADAGYFPFVLIGMATNAAMLTALTGLSRSLQLQQPSGVLKPLLFSQTRSEVVLLLSSIYPFARGAAELLAYLAAGSALSGFPLGRANLQGALIVGFLAIMAFASLGFLTAAFTVLFRCGNPVLWVLASSSWLLGGVLYPPALLPPLLRAGADLLPLTHALHGIRTALLDGAPITDLLPTAGVLAGFSLIMLPLGLVVFNIGLWHARVRGTLAGW